MIVMRSLRLLFKSLLYSPLQMYRTKIALLHQHASPTWPFPPPFLAHMRGFCSSLSYRGVQPHWESKCVDNLSFRSLLRELGDLCT